MNPEKSSSENSASEARRRRTRRQIPYPAFPLKAALQIASAIAEYNACKPYSRLSIADCIGRTPESSAFRQLISSSSAYGLTEGGYQSQTISLTPLGNSIVAPRTSDEKAQGIIKAAMSIELFEKLYKHFDQHKIPPDDLFKNTLIRDYSLDVSLAKECIERFKEDGRFTGLIRNVAGAERVSMHDAALNLEYDAQNEEGDSDDAVIEDGDESASSSDVSDANDVSPLETPSVEKAEKTKVFISHGKNTDIVDQIKTMLDFANLENEVAIESETTAIPVPDKIREAMKRCNAAVTCVTADEEHKNESGDYTINENVLIEIGAAFVLYDRRVVLVWDRRLSVPSNLQGLYRCEFEGDELSWSAGMNLMKAINEFKGSTA